MFLFKTMWQIGIGKESTTTTNIGKRDLKTTTMINKMSIKSFNRLGRSMNKNETQQSRSVEQRHVPINIQKMPSLTMMRQEGLRNDSTPTTHIG